ncbi:MAG: threonine ammonia-lyase [Planctomycetes bacterium]|nr:threonine ammonia-lyase [Planctomycetota bacterium]
MTTLPVTAAHIHSAAAAIHGHVVRTPTLVAPRLGEMAAARLAFKLENLQFTGSFKDRGACLKLQRLAQSPNPPTGVIAASAGNHAQGVAHHANRLGLAATIVMPVSTPFAKVERTEAHGANVVLRGESVSESYVTARQLADERELELIHPYDDKDIIAGQGTAAIELFEDAPHLDTLVVPIGGGGLISGMAIEARRHRPDIRVIGVQTALCPSMFARVRNEPMPVLRTNTLADGIAVKSPGELTAPIIQALVDDILLVDEAAIETAIQVLASHGKIVAEGAGAAAFAAVLSNRDLFRNRDVGIVISGGNIDRRLLSTVLLRGLQHDGKVARLRIQIPDLPGTLAQITEMIGAAGADIVDIEHERLFVEVAGRHAELVVVMETHGSSHVDRILTSLRDAGFKAQLG